MPGGLAGDEPVNDADAVVVVIAHVQALLG